MSDEDEPGLSIRPMSESQMRDFFAEQDAAGIEGRWLGGGAEKLGLTGRVDPEERDAVWFSGNPEAASRAYRSEARPIEPSPASKTPALPTAPQAYPVCPPIQPQPVQWAPSPPPAPAIRRGFSTAALVFGISSLFIGVLGVVQLVGLVLSIVGLFREPGFRARATVGLVLSSISLIGWIGFLTLILVSAKSPT